MESSWSQSSPVAWQSVSWCDGLPVSHHRLTRRKSVLHEQRSNLTFALSLALLAVLIGVIPVGASPTPVGPPVLPGLHRSLGSPRAPVHVVPADACSSLTAVPSPNPSRDDVLTGVSAPTTSFAWAAGYQGNGSGLNQTLIEQWNGSAWRVVENPNTSTNN